MAGNRKTNRYNGGDRQTGQMARDLDKLAEYDAFVNNILPRLQQLLLDDKKSSRDIMSFAEKELVARMVTIALTPGSSPKDAMTAIKDLLDRTQGKAKETLTINQKYDQLEEAELDSLLISERESLKDLEH